MRRLERARDLQRQPHASRQEWARERLALDVLEDQIIGSDVVDLADMRMVERGDGARFLLEPIAGSPVVA